MFTAAIWSPCVNAAELKRRYAKSRGGHLFYALLIVGTIFLGAYTANFQESTLLFGKMLAPDNELLPAGYQDAITPNAQNTRNIIYFLLLAAVFIYGIISFQWWQGILFFFLTFFIGIPLAKRLLPKPGTSHFYEKIKRSLLKRQASYRKANDAMREEAINEVLSKFEALEVKK